MLWELQGKTYLGMVLERFGNGLGKLLGIASSGLGRAGASFRVYEKLHVTHPLVHWAKGYIGVSTTVDARLRQCQTS